MDANALPAEQPAITLSIPADPSFVPLTALTQRQVLREPASSLGQVLGNKPGIAETSFAAGASRPVIRGLTGFRVSTQENGITSGDVAALSDDHVVPTDPITAQQIEVVRGPATLRYGSRAIGGVVNVINGRIPEFAPPNGTRIETQGALSSVDNGRVGSVLAEQGVGGFVLHADTFYRQADDYGTPEGKQANTRLFARGNAIGGSYVFKDGFLGLAYQTYGSTYFIPGIEAAASQNHLNVDQSKLTSRGEFRVGEYGVDTVRGSFGSTYYHHDEVDGRDPDTGQAINDIGSAFKQQTNEARLEVQHLPFTLGFGEIRGAVGVQTSQRDLKALSANGPLLPEAKTLNNAGYIFEEAQLTRPLRLQLAGRIESSNVKGAATDFAFTDGQFSGNAADLNPVAASRTFMPKSISAGFLYEFPRSVVARVTGTHVERAPDATELYYRGPHASTQTFEIGNPNLTIEGANTVEAGVKRALGGFRFDTSVFHTSFSNYVYKRFTGVKCEGSDCGMGGGLDQIAYSQRDARFIGAEVLGEYDISPLWRGTWGVQGQYDFVRATFEDGSFVPKIPPHRLGGGVYYYDSDILARITLLHAFEQDEFADFDTPTPDYNLLNAEISYAFKTDPLAYLSPTYVIGLRGENLLNDDIRNAVSYKKDEVLQPGRSVRLFGSVKLN